MRLHQRVGRLNRYGQKFQVEVINLRNPDTVESRIWDKLNSKIDNIMKTLGSAMDEPEDLLQLVLGMASPSLFREVFTGGANVAPESLSRWFDTKTAKFGGQDAINAVKDIVGNCARFDFRQVSSQLPRIDLPALQPFFEGMLSLNSRRVSRGVDGLTFKTPENWLDNPAVRIAYEDMVFDRNLTGEDAAKRVLGVGHKVIDAAIQQALDCTASVATVSANKLNKPLVIFKLFDSVTGIKTNIRTRIVGVEHSLEVNGSRRMLHDWELLQQLNLLHGGRDIKAESSPLPDRIDEIQRVVDSSNEELNSRIEELDIPFKRPTIELYTILWPYSE